MLDWQTVQSFDHEQNFGTRYNCTLKNQRGIPAGWTGCVRYAWKLGGWKWELWHGGHSPERQSWVPYKNAEDAKKAFAAMLEMVLHHA